MPQQVWFTHVCGEVPQKPCFFAQTGHVHDASSNGSCNRRFCLLRLRIVVSVLVAKAPSCPNQAHTSAWSSNCATICTMFLKFFASKAESWPAPVWPGESMFQPPRLNLAFGHCIATPLTEARGSNVFVGASVPVAGPAKWAPKLPATVGLKSTLARAQKLSVISQQRQLSRDISTAVANPL